ncbi:MAG: hypothetical protein ACLQVF_26580 [Isosphaeraceae bacterium]
MLTSVFSWLLQYVLGGLAALPHHFVATYGWQGVAALVAGGHVAVQIVKKSAKPGLKLAALAGVAILAAWWFWMSGGTPQPVPKPVKGGSGSPSGPVASKGAAKPKPKSKQAKLPQQPGLANGLGLSFPPGTGTVLVPLPGGLGGAFVVPMPKIVTSTAPHHGGGHGTVKSRQSHSAAPPARMPGPAAKPATLPKPNPMPQPSAGKNAGTTPSPAAPPPATAPKPAPPAKRSSQARVNPSNSPQARGPVASGNPGNRGYGSSGVQAPPASRAASSRAMQRYYQAQLDAWIYRNAAGYSGLGPMVGGFHPYGGHPTGGQHPQAGAHGHHLR